MTEPPGAGARSELPGSGGSDPRRAFPSRERRPPSASPAPRRTGRRESGPPAAPARAPRPPAGAPRRAFPAAPGPCSRRHRRVLGHTFSPRRSASRLRSRKAGPASVRGIAPGNLKKPRVRRMIPASPGRSATVPPWYIRGGRKIAYAALECQTLEPGRGSGERPLARPLRPEGNLGSGRRGRDLSERAGVRSVRAAVPANLLDLRLLRGAFAGLLALAGVHVDVPFEHAALVDDQVRLLERDLAQKAPLRMDLELLPDMDRAGHLAADRQDADVDIRLDLPVLADHQLLLADDLPLHLSIDPKHVAETDRALDLGPLGEKPADVVLADMILQQGIFAERHYEPSLHRRRLLRRGATIRISAPAPRSTGSYKSDRAPRSRGNRSRPSRPDPSPRSAPWCEAPGAASPRPRRHSGLPGVPRRPDACRFAPDD